MRLILVITALLTGCATAPAPKLDAPVPAPAAVDLEKVGQGIDSTAARVAAAVVVARELNKAGQPAKVDAELSVAAAFLPFPGDGDLAVARQRSATATPAEYNAQLQKAQEKQKAMDAAWRTLESQAAASKKAVTDRDARITDLTAELDRARKDASESIWTITGAALAVIGALCTAFVGPRIGIPILFCGAFAGAVPFIIESPWFGWLAIGTAATAAGLGIWWLYDRVRDDVNDPHLPDGPAKE